MESSTEASAADRFWRHYAVFLASPIRPMPRVRSIQTRRSSSTAAAEAAPYKSTVLCASYGHFVGQSVAFGCSSALVRQLDLSGWSVPPPFNQASLRQQPEASGGIDLLHSTRPRSG